MLAMSGDLLRTNACVFAHNGILGYPASGGSNSPAA